MTSFPRNIFLIGYRGSGKTTVARLLGEKLGWPGCDADALLEARAGRSIRDIFAEQGETAFRDLESAILSELCAAERQVVATGGGVILREENRQKLKEAGLVVWLTAPSAVLWHRLQDDATTAQRRPNLAQGGLAEIEEQLRFREPLYAVCADVTLDTNERQPSELVETILGML